MNQAGLTVRDVDFEHWEWEYKVEKIRMEHWNIRRTFSKPHNISKKVFIVSVFSLLGFGFSFGGIMIILEQIFAKLMRRKTFSFREVRTSL